MATNGSKKKIHDEIKEKLGRVPEWMTRLPDEALPGFWAQMREIELGETAIPNKYKELIGIAIAGVRGCRYCALFHTESAKVFGATDREIAEAAAIAGFTSSASTFIHAEQIDYERFAKETRDIVAHVKKQMKAQGKTERTRPGAQA